MTKCCAWTLAAVATVLSLVCIFVPSISQLSRSHTVAGFSASLAIWALTSVVVSKVGDALRETSTGPLVDALWREDKRRKKYGWLIGLFETAIFFAAWLLPVAWALGAAWLAFKGLLYWESTSFTKIPEAPETDPERVQYVIDRQRLGAYHSTKLLVGTAANILAGLIGAVLAHWVESAPTGF